MEFIATLFGSQVSLNSMFQIGVDVIILGLLGVILTVKKPRISKKDEEVMKSFEKIVDETALISQKFEFNLQKRQDLLQQITAKLDQRIQQAEGLCARLDQLSLTSAEKNRGSGLFARRTAPPWGRPAENILPRQKGTGCL